MEHNVLWLFALALLLLVPGYYLVLGRDTEPFGRTWFLDSDERARYRVVFYRLLVWLLSAGVIGLFWSSVLRWFSGGTAS